jgi:hypothetical protein
MPNLQYNGVRTHLRVEPNATLTSNRAEVGICAVKVNSPCTFNLVREQLRIHQRGVNSHLPTRGAVQRCGSQECRKVIRGSDQREQIAAKNHQTRCGRFTTPESPIGTDPFGRRGALSGQGESGRIEINTDELPLGGIEGGQDAACTATDLKNGSVRFRRYLPPIRQVTVGGGG